MKTLCSTSIRNCWPEYFWLGTQRVSLLGFFLLFCLVSALVSASLIFFPSSESLAIGSASYSATVPQTRTDLSAILINLFRHFSFAVKPSPRSLASLVSSLFSADERFSTICKTFGWIQIVFCSLYVWIWKCPPILRFHLMIFVTFSLFPQNVYRSSSSLVRGVWIVLNFGVLFSPFTAFVKSSTDGNFISHLLHHFQKTVFISCGLCWWQQWQELQLLLVKNEGYELKLVQVSRYLIMVECLLCPCKQLPVLVLKLDFADFWKP